MSAREDLRRQISGLEKQAEQLRAVDANYGASFAEAQAKRLRARLDESHPERPDALTGAGRLRGTARVSGEPVEPRSKRGP